MARESSLLIVGVGSIGARHLRCFQQTGRVRVALCEVDADLRARVAAEYGVDRAYADLDAALADRHDAAVIATPAHLHVPQAQRLAEAGLHLLIEKPLSIGLEGIARLETTLREAGRTAAVAYVHRANPLLQGMKAAIDSGRFGRPVQVVAVSGQHFPTFRPAYRATYFRDHATGGGAIQDALTHTLNAAEWLVGPIDRVVTDAARQVLDGIDVEDTVGLLARHGGVLGSYTLNQHQAPNEFAITVVCESGTVRYEPLRHRWRWMVRPDEPWHDESHAPFTRDALFVRQADAFLDLVDGRAQPLCTIAEARHTLAAVLAALDSLRHEAWRRVAE